VLDDNREFVYTVYTNRGGDGMADKPGTPSGSDALEKPGWPEGFWEELKRMPLPADFELGEDLPDQADRAIGWFDEPINDGQSCQ